jgi:hypothetical protein
MIDVHSYKNISGDIITYNDINYSNQTSFPRDYVDKQGKTHQPIQLILETVDEQTEKTIIDYIHDKKKDQLLRTTLNQIGRVFGEEMNQPEYFKHFKAQHLKPGDGMDFIDDSDAKTIQILRYKPKPLTVIVVLGQSILFTLMNKKSRKKWDIWVPSKSMVVIDNENYEFLRGVAKRPTDIVMVQGESKTIKRGDTYLLTFQG